MTRNLVVAAVLAVAAFAASGALAAHGSVCVAPGGAGGCYSTIQDGVDHAGNRGRVSVAAGTYTEEVTITTPVTLQGEGATIDASGQDNGVVVDGVSRATISGFTVENADLEGILVENSSHVTILDNHVTANDKRRNSSGVCDPVPYPLQGDDCGEGIHLLGTSHSTVMGNLVDGNAGGIKLTDETGPTYDNNIVRNTVQSNPYDCGITLASHTSGAGVYRNSVVDNTSTGNGGSGAGVYAFPAGASAYDNLIVHNTLTNNGFAGVAIHSHDSGQNVNGNSVVNNVVSGNGADDEFGGPNATTGIDVISSVVPIARVTIAANRIDDEQDGIYLSGVQHVGGLPSNKFGGSVTTPVTGP